jgi:ABC-2 type transport system ATP-binding protein
MAQRLGIAGALLGDPENVMLDEPVNGLDPEGIVWIRTLLQRLAGEGRTVFVSSHLMSEMELMADHFVIIGRGCLVADVSADELHAMVATTVTVRSDELGRLVPRLRGPGVTVTPIDRTTIAVAGPTAAEIGALARDEAVALEELATHRSSLEDIFMELTATTVEYRGGVERTERAA